MSYYKIQKIMLLDDYSNHDLTDLITDPSFQKWVLEGDEESGRFWFAYMEKYPNKRPKVLEAKNLLELIRIDVPNIDASDKQEVWQKILKDTIWNGKTINKSKSSYSKSFGSRDTKADKIISLNPEVELHKYRSRTNSSLWMKIAVSFIIISSISLLFYFISVEKSQQLEQQLAVERIEKSNPWGQKSTIFLQDGSEVILNSGSRISYNKNFDKDKREIYLQGEAYFKVAKDPDRPFLVIAEGVITKVTGTEFNIRAFNTEPIEVALVEGEVVVNSEAQELILKPGEGCSFSIDTNYLNKFVFDPKEYISWKEGTLYFFEAKESEVFKKLEQWYGVKIIKNNNSNKNWAYTGEFHRQSLQHVLVSIGYAMDFTFDIKEDNIIINYK